MSILTVEQAEKVAGDWRGGRRSTGEKDSPAGPLFPTGDYAEADIIAQADAYTDTREWLFGVASC